MSKKKRKGAANSIQPANKPTTSAEDPDSRRLKDLFDTAKSSNPVSSIGKASISEKSRLQSMEDLSKKHKLLEEEIEALSSKKEKVQEELDILLKNAENIKTREEELND